MMTGDRRGLMRMVTVIEPILGGTSTLAGGAIVDLKRSSEVDLSTERRRHMVRDSTVGEALRSPSGLPTCSPNERGQSIHRREGPAE